MPDLSDDKTRHPVIWTPEDAANFITAAIREAQNPLNTALRTRGIPKTVFALFVVVLLGALAGSWQYFLYENSFWKREAARLESERGELERWRTERLSAPNPADEKRVADAASQAQQATEREQKALARVAELERQLGDASANASTDRQSLTQAKKELEEKVGSLQSEVDSLKKNEEDMKSLKSVREENVTLKKQLAEALRRAELLSLQLEGKEEEQAALVKQLKALRALNQPENETK